IYTLSLHDALPIYMDPRLKEPRNVDVSALCDVNGARLDAAKQWAPQAKTYTDFRKTLADKDIDVVVIGTHDPWHATMVIMACDAGKDVYVEKPVMYRVGEARSEEHTSELQSLT